MLLRMDCQQLQWMLLWPSAACRLHDLQHAGSTLLLPPLLRTWWMMPEPGFQKPMPYLAPAEARKSYTSLLVWMAAARSATPPNLPSLFACKGSCQSVEDRR